MNIRNLGKQLRASSPPLSLKGWDNSTDAPVYAFHRNEVLATVTINPFLSGRRYLVFVQDLSLIAAGGEDAAYGAVSYLDEVDGEVLRLARILLARRVDG